MACPLSRLKIDFEARNWPYRDTHGDVRKEKKSKSKQSDNLEADVQSQIDRSLQPLLGMIQQAAMPSATWQAAHKGVPQLGDLGDLPPGFKLSPPTRTGSNPAPVTDNSATVLVKACPLASVVTAASSAMKPPEPKPLETELSVSTATSFEQRMVAVAVARTKRGNMTQTRKIGLLE